MSSSNQYNEFHETESSTAATHGHGVYVSSGAVHRDYRFAPGGYGDEYSHSAFTYDPNAASFAPMTAALFPDANPVGLECLSAGPMNGWTGTEITMSLRCRHPIQYQRTKAYALAFGNRSEGHLQDNGSDGHFQYHMFKVQAPQAARPSPDGQLDAPLSVQLEDIGGQILAFVDAGLFRYEPSLKPPSDAASATSASSRKRRLSATSPSDIQVPVKKTSSQRLQMRSHDQSRRTSSAFGSESANDAVPSPGLSSAGPPSAASSAFGSQAFAFPGYGGKMTLPHHGSLDDQSASVSSAQSGEGGASPLTAPGSHPRVGGTQGGGSASADASRQAHDRPAHGVGGQNPPLVRTVTVPNPAPRRGFDPPARSDSFNPYTIYQDNKAYLDIKGDLDAMAEGWDGAEKRAQRRLVEFSRQQEGNHVSTTFKPVSLEERAPNSICVSCIWWEEKEEAYVTSVDTIQLLESLVAVRFTVEEKNRIRRNLEGFRPLTVAKGKVESERFFKTIMDFPSPKPRNIEKDVKVFPWRVLKHALKKIVGKYSASYASTQARIPNPAAPTHAAGGPVYEYYSPMPVTAIGGPSGSRTAPPRQVHYPPTSHPMERPPMPMGSHSFPIYAVPSDAIPHPSMPSAPLQYGPIQQQSPLQYGVGDYGPRPDQAWPRTMQGGESQQHGAPMHPLQALHAHQQPQQQSQLPPANEARGWQYGAYGEQAADPSSHVSPSTAHAVHQPQGMDPQRQGRSPGFPGTHPYAMQDPRYQYAPYTGAQSSPQ